MRVIISERCKKSPSVWHEILWIFVNAMLLPTESMVYEFDSFRIDAGKRLLWNGGGEPIPLTPKVFDTLFYLVENAGKLIEKDELMSAIWPDTVVEENNLNKNISALRQILGEKRGEHRFIATVPGTGYKFVADVRVIAGKTVRQISDNDLPNDMQVHNQPRGRFIFAGVAVLIVAVMTGSFFLSRRNTPVSPGIPKTIAILPFKPLVAEDPDEGLEFGMADALIMRLGNNREIVVRPLSSVIGYGKLEQDAVQAGRDLGADLVLDGSVQRSGDKLRVNVRLVRVTDGTVVWAEPFNEKFTDIPDVQDAIAKKVGTALAIHLGGDDKSDHEKRYTNNPEAYENYARARYHLLRVTPQHLRSAIGSFQQAIDADPNYALAYAGLAEAYRIQAMAAVAPPNDVFPKAKALATRALELDESIADAHTVLGFVAFLYERDWENGEKEIKRAIELEPNSPDARRAYALLLSAIGRKEDAVREARLSRELAPQTQTYGSVEASILFSAGHLDEAMFRIDKVLELDDNFLHGHFIKGRILAYQGRYEEAIREWERAREIAPDAVFPMSSIGYAFARSGRRDEALAILEKLRSISVSRYVASEDFALVYSGLGDNKTALSYLEKALDERGTLMPFVRNESGFDNFRSEPRFAALVESMHFPE
jgi:DNA-binding winged helix-turn-helix (wHTH) protein/TolB-like protein/tetratricopeptide (TPR) repeat protein